MQLEQASKFDPKITPARGLNLIGSETGATYVPGVGGGKKIAISWQLVDATVGYDINKGRQTNRELRKKTK